MEYMPDFRLLHPASVAEALAARKDNPEARFVAGGTDLVPNIRRGIEAPPALIDLNGVDALRTIDDADGGGLRIGTAVTLAELIDDPRVRDRFPVVVEAARSVAAHTHRQVATLGGNLCLDTRCVYYNQSEWWRSSNAYCFKSRGDICHVAPKTVACFAAFSGDVAPALIVLGAEAEIASPDGGRVIPLTDMYRDDGKDHLRLAGDEMLVAVRVPAAPTRQKGGRAGYAKSRVRGAIDFPLAGVAAALRTDGANVAELRLALTGTNAMPILLTGTEKFAGAPLDDDALDRLAALPSKQMQPMTSTFTPPGYRRRVVANLVRSLVRRLYGEATRA
jgi:4-hydroxybenzoyl-CoA reductase subunit beta